MHWRIFYLFLTLPFFHSYAQSYVAVNVDNDLYFGTDRYYSSGIFLHYGQRKLEDSLAATKTRHWTLGQEITNPHLRLTEQLEKIDYPYNGWLFLGYEETVFEQPQKGYGLGAEIGVTGGELSLAKPIQNLYHERVLGLPPLSWAATQATAFHANLAASYFNALEWRPTLHWVFYGKAQLGTFRSSMLSRAGFQWSSFNALPFFGHRLENLQKGFAFYVGMQGEFRWHDYAVEGSLFRNNAALAVESVPLKHEWEIGALYQGGQWRCSVLFNNASKDVRTQRFSRHNYLNITLTKLF